MRGKYNNTVSSLAQKALNTIIKWCLREGFNVNSDKTTVVPFTKRRKLTLTAPKVKGQTIALSDKVKYLGITLDRKLTWNVHMDNTISKATMALWTCRRIFGKTWGLKPKMIHWLYIMVVRPIVTYGSLIWWTKTKQIMAQKKLQSLQRLACLGITGAAPTTPSAALEVLIDLLPLHEQIRKEGLMSALRMGWTSPCLIKGHSEIINLVKPEITHMPSDTMPIEFNFESRFEVVIDNRLNSMNRVKELHKYPTIWYTDASQTDSGTGIGIFGPKHKESIPLGQGPSVVQAEIIAIERCAQVCMEKGYRGQHIFILSDSQSALRNLKAYSFDSRITWNCNQALNRLAKGNKLTLMWVPGHTGIEGNIQADALAKKGASAPTTGPGPSCGLSKAHRRTVIQEWESRCKTVHWDSAPGQRQSKMFIDISTRRAKQLLCLSKLEIRLVTGLLTGHCPVMYHLHNVGKEDNPTCRLCGLANETTQHILCECVELATTRHDLMGGTTTTPSQIRALSPRTLINFAKEVEFLGIH